MKILITIIIIFSLNINNCKKFKFEKSNILIENDINNFKTPKTINKSKNILNLFQYNSSNKIISSTKPIMFIELANIKNQIFINSNIIKKLIFTDKSFVKSNNKIIEIRNQWNKFIFDCLTKINILENKIKKLNKQIKKSKIQTQNKQIKNFLIKKDELESKIEFLNTCNIKKHNSQHINNVGYFINQTYKTKLFEIFMQKISFLKEKKILKNNNFLLEIKNIENFNNIKIYNFYNLKNIKIILKEKLAQLNLDSFKFSKENKKILQLDSLLKKTKHDLLVLINFSLNKKLPLFITKLKKNLFAIIFATKKTINKLAIGLLNKTRNNNNYQLKQLKIVDLPKRWIKISFNYSPAKLLTNKLYLKQIYMTVKIKDKKIIIKL